MSMSVTIATEAEDFSLLSKCSTNLLIEVLVHHLQRIRGRQLKPRNTLSITPSFSIESRLFGILADGIIRDFHAISGPSRNFVVQNSMNDIMVLCVPRDDLDARMVRRIVVEIQKREGSLGAMDMSVMPTIQRQKAHSSGSSREYEFVTDDEESQNDQNEQNEQNDGQAQASVIYSGK